MSPTRNHQDSQGAEARECEDRRRELFVNLGKRSLRRSLRRDVTAVFFCLAGVGEKAEADLSQRCTQTGQEAKDTSYNKGNSNIWGEPCICAAVHLTHGGH